MRQQQSRYDEQSRYDAAVRAMAELAAEGIGTLEERIARPWTSAPYRIASLEARWSRDEWHAHVRRIVDRLQSIRGISIRLEIIFEGVGVFVSITRDLTPDEYARLSAGETLVVRESAEVVG